MPLRFWNEVNFPKEVLKGIESAGYEKPSPIQRQAIPIGQARRDIIGIAETGMYILSSDIYCILLFSHNNTIT